MPTRTLLVLCCLAAVAASPARAADPGTWALTGQVRVPVDYRQGMAWRSGDVLFSGPFTGVYRTDSRLHEKARNQNAIPQDVIQREGYSHIGDVTLDVLTGTGTALLLPLECYAPFEADQNPCDNGAIGVVDPQTLKWQRYVKLDPAEIPKAMWLAVEPERDLAWTSSGNDLLGYRISEILNPANAAPGGPLLHAAARLPDALTGHGATGAVVVAGRLYVATQNGATMEIYSYDTKTGSRQLEIERPAGGEVEGMDFGSYVSGVLHVEVAKGSLTPVDLLSFARRGTRLRLLASRGVKAGKAAKVTVHVTIAGDGLRVPMQGVKVTLAGKKATTDAAGNAVLRVKLRRRTYTARAAMPGLAAGIAHVRAS